MKKIFSFLLFLISFLILNGVSQANWDNCSNYTYSNCPSSCERVCVSSSCNRMWCTADCDWPNSCIAKKNIVCTKEYKPVCWYKDWVKKTYSNRCLASVDNARFITEWKCSLVNMFRIWQIENKYKYVKINYSYSWSVLFKYGYDWKLQYAFTNIWKSIKFGDNYKYKVIPGKIYTYYFYDTKTKKYLWAKWEFIAKREEIKCPVYDMANPPYWCYYNFEKYYYSWKLCKRPWKLICENREDFKLWKIINWDWYTEINYSYTWTWELLFWYYSADKKEKYKFTVFWWKIKLWDNYKYKINPWKKYYFGFYNSITKKILSKWSFIAKEKIIKREKITWLYSLSFSHPSWTISSTRNKVFLIKFDLINWKIVNKKVLLELWTFISDLYKISYSSINPPKKCYDSKFVWTKYEWIKDQYWMYISNSKEELVNKIRLWQIWKYPANFWWDLCYWWNFWTAFTPNKKLVEKLEWILEKEVKCWNLNWKNLNEMPIKTDKGLCINWDVWKISLDYPGYYWNCIWKNQKRVFCNAKTVKKCDYSYNPVCVINNEKTWFIKSLNIVTLDNQCLANFYWTKVLYYWKCEKDYKIDWECWKLKWKFWWKFIDYYLNSNNNNLCLTWKTINFRDWKNFNEKIDIEYNWECKWTNWWKTISCKTWKLKENFNDNCAKLWEYTDYRIEKQCCKWLTLSMKKWFSSSYNYFWTPVVWWEMQCLKIWDWICDTRYEDKYNSPKDCNIKENFETFSKKSKDSVIKKLEIYIENLKFSKMSDEIKKSKLEKLTKIISNLIEKN